MIIALARLAFDFTVEVPASELVSTGSGMVSIENQRQMLVDSLSGSSAVALFMDIRDLLPDGIFGLVPDDFDTGLNLLGESMGYP